MGAANGQANENKNGLPKGKIIAGLDIGGSKVCMVIGHLCENGDLDVIGLGAAPSIGIRKGVVVNIEATTESILKAKEEAELMAGFEIHRIFVSLGGAHIKSFDSKGMIAITNSEVSHADINRVIEAAKAVAVPTDKDVIHVLPKEFKVDEQDGISDPIGMSGVRLESSVHIVTGGHTAMQNVIKCTEKANLQILGFVLEPFASAQACLSEDEKKLGAAVVDMGSGTTDIVIYNQGSLCYTASLPVGGSHVTNDVAVGMRTPQGAAEEIKKKHGSALSSMIDPTEMVEIDGVGGRSYRTVKRRDLCEVIEPRVEEILSLVKRSIDESGMSQLLGSGVVLTGGASQLDGIVELGEFVLDVPVRRGTALHIGGLSETVRSPMYATAVGLLFFAKQQKDNSALKLELEPSFLENMQRKIRSLFG